MNLELSSFQISVFLSHMVVAVIFGYNCLQLCFTLKHETRLKVLPLVLMCFCSLILCSFLGFGILDPIATQFGDLIYISTWAFGMGVYYFYMIGISRFLGSRNTRLANAIKAYGVGLLFYFGDLIYYLITGTSLLSPVNTGSKSLFFEYMHFSLAPNLFNSILSTSMAVLFMYSCIILWKELNQTRPKEYLLKIGMFLSLIGLFNDASLGSGYFYYGFPLSFLGALFESIRFTNYFQYKAYSRLNVLQDEVTKVAKAAHVGLAAGSIAHDIRNPLTIIFGNLQVIKSKIKTENLSFDLEKFLKRIEISTERIENIVSTYTNLLYHNKQEELKEYNLKELIEASIANCEYRVKSSSLSIFEEINPDLFLKCNKTEVIMTVSNLIVNACDATKDLESPWVRITNRMVDGQFAIEVTDSGSGIPEDIVHKIFEPQFTTKKQGEGTGLGLNIIRELISRRKWDIVVDKNSSNTCFQVLIPVSFISENPNKLMNQKSS